MNRLGSASRRFAAAYARLRRIANVAADPTLVTHLASADEPGDPKTAQQLGAFAAATAGLPGERSIANSAGLIAWPDTRADWVDPDSRSTACLPSRRARASASACGPR